MTRLPRVGISRCLLGEDVRYDGRNKYERPLIERLSSRVEWVPVCPELEVGMGVPREPVQLVAIATEPVRLLGVESGRDWTARMHSWTGERLAALKELGLSGFVLKSASPSCGMREVPVVGAEPAPGIFASALMAAMPDLPIEDEVRLRHHDVLEEFLRRVQDFVPRRARRFLATKNTTSTKD